MKYSSFSKASDSHNHSLQTLNLLYEYDDFMESIDRVVDLGSGSQLLDLEWWVTRTTRDENQVPLEIQGTAIDIEVPARQINNVSFTRTDLHSINARKKKTTFDVLWCHDTFQYLRDPYGALKNWRGIASDDAMLVLILPQTISIENNIQEFNLHPGHTYIHTMTSLLYMLALNGWDCKSGFFKKTPGNPWIHAIVYKSQCEPLDPGTSWYKLNELNLLPESAEKSIFKYGYPKQCDLVLPWLDKSLTWMGQQ